MTKSSVGSESQICAKLCYDGPLALSREGREARVGGQFGSERRDRETVEANEVKDLISTARDRNTWKGKRFWTEAGI